MSNNPYPPGQWPNPNPQQSPGGQAGWGQPGQPGAAPGGNPQAGYPQENAAPQQAPGTPPQLAAQPGWPPPGSPQGAQQGWPQQGAPQNWPQQGANQGAQQGWPAPGAQQVVQQGWPQQGQGAQQGWQPQNAPPGAQQGWPQQGAQNPPQGWPPGGGQQSPQQGWPAAEATQVAQQGWQPPGMQQGAQQGWQPGGGSQPGMPAGHPAQFPATSASSPEAAVVPATPPSKSSSVFSFGWMRMLQIGGAILVALAAVGYGLWTNSRKYVYIDNAFDEAVTVKVDGQAQTISAHTFVRLSVSGGQKLPMESKLPTGKTEKYTVQVPSVGFLSNWEGVYNIGKEGRYALVSATYNRTGGKTKADLIGEGQRFFEIPAGARGGTFDTKFPSSIKSKSSSTTISRVCHAVFSTDKEEEYSVPCAE